MRKTKQVILLLLLISSMSFAQDTTKSKSIKIYSNYDFSSWYLYAISDAAVATGNFGVEQETNLFYFSPVFAWNNKKGNSFEIEISRFRYHKNYQKIDDLIVDTEQEFILGPDSKIKEFELFFRFEYKIKLFKKKDLGKFSPSLGFSIMPFITNYKSEPTQSSIFPHSKFRAGAKFSIIPGLEYKINENWYLDLNIPLDAGSIFYQSNKNGDPSLNINEQANDYFVLSLTPFNYALRFGIGLRI